jgi:hypothetical protein
MVKLGVVAHAYKSYTQEMKRNNCELQVTLSQKDKHKTNKKQKKMMQLY